MTRAILDFWFLPPDHPGHGQQRPEWFRKNETFDAEIRERFGADIEVALNTTPGAGSDEALLARILLLDQGRIVSAGTPAEVAGMPGSITGAYLSGRQRVAAPAQRRKPGHKALTIYGARQHNLQNITVRIPLGVLVALTFIGLPFVVRTVQPVLEDVEHEHPAIAEKRAGHIECETQGQRQVHEVR